MSEASRVLERVRRALATARLPGAPLPATTGLPEIADLPSAFCEALEALGGRVFSPEPHAVVDLVLERVRHAGAGDVMAWDDLPVPGLTNAFAEAGIRVLDAMLPSTTEERKRRLVELEGAVAGITGAEVGIAETGSLVVASGPGRSRLAWLLPPHHIALLARARLLPTLEAVLAAQPTLCEGRAEVALIAGPSRTADIELTLTRGVHGPRELDVILLP